MEPLTPDAATGYPARMSSSRRTFLRGAAAVGVAMMGLPRWAMAGPAQGRGRRSTEGLEGLGPLIPDPAGILDLPEGFTYWTLSSAGEKMDDGLLVPARHDGMAAFAGENGRTVLVRNHENRVGLGAPFGDANELLAGVDLTKLFDAGHPERACLGGTTTVVVDLAERRVEKHWMSLAGTLVNCAGGPTPWGSWISCEETVSKAGGPLQRDHGWCFEVPADHEGLVDPVPLVGLGRFKHEAVAIDPASGCVYLTEDRSDGLLYRFIPDQPGSLGEGGKLQALRVRGASSVDTSNTSSFTRIEPGEEIEVDWVDLDDPEAPADDLRKRGFLAGAARFSRGEGIWYGNGAVYFACTAGGAARKGQVWKYVPSPNEGRIREQGEQRGRRGRRGRRELRESGKLSLLLEPNDASTLENCDNLCVAPWGHLVICEDGNEDDRVLGATPEGRIYVIARNAGNHSELAGATFSPDGSTLFFNIQTSGLTVAVTGPWDRARNL